EHVGREGERAPAAGAEHAAHLVQLVGAARRDRDVGPGGAQRERDRAPDAAPAAGHERDAAGEARALRHARLSTAGVRATARRPEATPARPPALLPLARPLAHQGLQLRDRPLDLGLPRAARRDQAVGVLELAERLLELAAQPRGERQVVEALGLVALAP